MTASRVGPGEEAAAVVPGALPPWRVLPLPAPPPFSARSAVRLIGPGIIALGAAIGSGEWLLGPALTAKYGPSFFWIASVSIIFQVVLNLAMLRYTLATGEPVLVGFMRMRPGSAFWGWTYALLLFLQTGWPGFALSAATAVVAAGKGSLTGAADRPAIMIAGYATFLVTGLLLSLGRRVERTLELAQWFMVVWILLFLVGVGVLVVPGRTWAAVFAGFLGVGSRREVSGSDWILIASFAAYAGQGGLTNMAVTHWLRDKGWGMAHHTGYIGGLSGDASVRLSSVGAIFERTPEQLARFREWLRFARFEQVWVFGLGCLVGMALPALITVTFVAQGANVTGGWATAVYQAEGLGRVFGKVAWFLTLLNGFWILFSTQLGAMDGVARTVTDALWTGSARVREAARGDVRRLYFLALGAYLLFGAVAINFSTPGGLVLIGSFIAAANFVILTVHVLVLDRRLLPPELRLPRAARAVLLGGVVLFSGLTILGIRSLFR